MRTLLFIFPCLIPRPSRCVPRETAEEIDAFLKKHGYTKVKLIEEGYKSLLEQAGEINTDLAKIIDGYDDFFDFELRKFEEEKNNNKT